MAVVGDGQNRSPTRGGIWSPTAGLLTGQGFLHEGGRKLCEGGFGSSQEDVETNLVAVNSNTEDLRQHTP